MKTFEERTNELCYNGYPVPPEYWNRFKLLAKEADQEITKQKTFIDAMVKKAADNSLDGYREMGAKLANMERELEKLQQKPMTVKEYQDSEIETRFCWIQHEEKILFAKYTSIVSYFSCFNKAYKPENIKYVWPIIKPGAVK